ncbi:unnamed protein product [Boreogadus saida]
MERPTSGGHRAAAVAPCAPGESTALHGSGRPAPRPSNSPPPPRAPCRGHHASARASALRGDPGPQGSLEGREEREEDCQPSSAPDPSAMPLVDPAQTSLSSAAAGETTSANIGHAAGAEQTPCVERRCDGEASLLRSTECKRPRLCTPHCPLTAQPPPGCLLLLTSRPRVPLASSWKHKAVDESDDLIVHRLWRVEERVEVVEEPASCGGERDEQREYIECWVSCFLGSLLLEAASFT